MVNQPEIITWRFPLLLTKKKKKIQVQIVLLLLLFVPEQRNGDHREILSTLGLFKCVRAPAEAQKPLRTQCSDLF